MQLCSFGSKVGLLTEPPLVLFSAGVREQDKVLFVGLLLGLPETTPCSPSQRKALSEMA